MKLAILRSASLEEKSAVFLLPRHLPRHVPHVSARLLLCTSLRIYIPILHDLHILFYDSNLFHDSSQFPEYSSACHILFMFASVCIVLTPLIFEVSDVPGS